MPLKAPSRKEPMAWCAGAMLMIAADDDLWWRRFVRFLESDARCDRQWPQCRPNLCTFISNLEISCPTDIRRRIKRKTHTVPNLARKAASSVFVHFCTFSNPRPYSLWSGRVWYDVSKCTQWGFHCGLAILRALLTRDLPPRHTTEYELRHIWLLLYYPPRKKDYYSFCTHHISLCPNTTRERNAIFSKVIL